jgi:chromosome segregation ATPase
MDFPLPPCKLYGNIIPLLIFPIEQVEKESVQYQNHVIELRDQMAETTKQINAMTGEFVAMKESSQHYDSIITGLQKENDRIRSLLEEMLQDKKKRDDQLDLVETEVEKRIDQMKKILEFKEATIEELRARLNRAALEGGLGEQDHQHSQQNVSMLTQALRDRDEQIEQLQEKLAEASRYKI